MRSYVLLSHRLATSSPAYPGMSPLRLRQLRGIARGDSSNSWEVSVGNHVGTHVDAPRHFDDSGRRIAEYSIEELVFRDACILDIPKGEGELLRREDLLGFEDTIASSSLIMIRTGFQEMRERDPATYTERGPCVSPDAARYLAGFQPGLRAVGLDTISLGSPMHREEGRASHRALLVGRDFLIIEDMDLAGKPAEYEVVIVAPLMIEEIDSAPCVVIGLPRGSGGRASS